MSLGKNSIILFLAVISALSSYASELFDQGLKAANQKNYSKAIDLFEKVVDNEKGNVSAYFNLGNCYYKSKKYGKAILSYERVLKYSPCDSEAPLNIELCYKKIGSTITWTSNTNGIQRMIYGVNPNKWAYLAIFWSFLLAFTILSFIRMKKTSWRRLMFFLMFGNSILLIAFTIAAGSASSYLTNDKFASVTKKSIPTFMNDLGEKAQLQIQEGTKLELILPLKKITEVRLHDGRTVLVDLSDIEVI